MLELAMSHAEIIEGNQVVGAQLQCLLKIFDCFVHVANARRENAEVVPGVRQRIGISRRELDGARKNLARFGVPLLIQANAPNAVESLGTCRIVAQRNPKGSLGLIQISALKEYRAIGQVVAPELDRVGHAGKRKCACQSLAGVLRNVAEVPLHVLAAYLALINLDDLSLVVDQE